MTYLLYTENADGERIYATDGDGNKVLASASTAQWWKNFNHDTQTMIQFKVEEV